MSLLPSWNALQQHSQFQEMAHGFQQRLRKEVCMNYPWLAGELFVLEGELGWGPGFREHEGEFYPPELPEARQRMTGFLQMLDMVQPNVDLLNELVSKARYQFDPKESTVLMLRTVLNARLLLRNTLANWMYGKIANYHSPYTLGGARMYYSVWGLQQNFTLAMAGMVWLLHKPLNPLVARAETVKRKILKRSLQALESSQKNGLVPDVGVAQETAIHGVIQGVSS
jgi:hypothetical protein